jgi:hypothetical protein
MSERPVSNLKIHTSEKFDGSRWRQYETPNALIWLTRSGRQLLASDRGLYAYFQEYIESLNDDESTPESGRPFFAKGSQSQIYSLGDNHLVVKESKQGGELLLPQMERMDRLVDAVERSCPRWIDVPHYYGILAPKSDPYRQFLLMERIDAGVSVGDVLEYGRPRTRTETGFLAEGAFEKFGPITPELRHEVQDRFFEMGGLLRKALVENRLSPDDYLPDIDHNQHNVVLERLQIPEAGSQLKFWVIDQ